MHHIDKLLSWTRKRIRFGRLTFSVGTIFIAIVFLVAGSGAIYARLGGTTDPAGSGSINLQKGLVGWWKMDGNAKDATPYGNNGTVFGATSSTDTKGMADKTLSFNGTGDYVAVADNPQLNPGSQNFTISLWFKASATGVANGSMLYNKENMFEASAGGGYFRYAWQPYWAWVGGNTFPVTVGTWYHATVVYDGVNQYMYKDGSLVYSRAQTGNMGSNANRLGIATRGTSGGNQSPFAGSIDDFRMYNRALSAGEVNALYEQYDPAIRTNTSENGLVGWWKMDGNARDSTPYGHDGTVTSATLTADRKGATNSAYAFDGTSSLITASAISNVTHLGNYSISAWVKTNTTAAQTIFQNSPNCNDRNGLGLSGGQASITYYDGTSYTRKSGPITTGQWAHIVGNNVNGALTLYINGQPQSGSTNIYLHCNPGVWIGRTSTLSAPNYFDGSIDDLRVYGRALTASEIQRQYQSYNSQINLNSSPQSTPNVNLGQGLVGYWPMNGDAIDATPYSRNASVVGASLTADRKSRVNSAYNFNGTGNYLETNSISNILPNTPSGSVSFWLNIPPQSSNFRRTLASTNNGAGLLDLYFTSDGTNGLYGNFGNASGWMCLGVNLTGGWKLVTLTGSATNKVRCYINGNYLYTNPASFSSIQIQNIVIGSYFNHAAYFLSGSIDDVRIWNREITPAEIQALYNSYR